MGPLFKLPELESWNGVNSKTKWASFGIRKPAKLEADGWAAFYLDSAARNGRGGAYEINEPDDPGSVEVPILELSPGDSNIEREPISKVQESILRLEIENLKKNK